ncbi:sugar transferase [Candidatus Leptofilum sp.]|uniref:sugar transferase n=1 Tax=Candidatus Leptofilum sp. TaxID=3241576 RepID=UPI003B59ABA2
MLRRFSVNFAIFSMVLDACLTFLALHLAVVIRPYLPAFPYLVPVEQITLSQTLYIIVPTVWVLTFLLSSVYDPKRIYKITDEVQTIVIAQAIASMIFAGILYLGFRDFSRWLFATFVVIDIALVVGWRVLMRLSFHIWRSPARERRVLIVGAGNTGRSVGKMMQSYDWAGLNLVGYLDDDTYKRKENLNILGTVADIRPVVEKHRIQDVVVALPQRAYGQINKLTITLHDLPVHVRVVPDYFSLALYRASVDDFGGIPMINLRDPALNEVQRLVKRIFDLVVGSTTMLCLLPILMLISILIRLDSKGPIIFRQKRVGENGRIFRMFKFRTMVPDADSHREEITEINPTNGRILFKKRPDDPRITRVGRFLRRTSLDELPQLLNVLLGDMSLVGPRPELPWLVDQYEPWQRKRFAVPQGMTGWWQVNGRSDKPLHLHTEDDLYYVQNYSIWMDIYILLKTPWVVLRGKGAY